jgi:hypothetical protein
VNRTRVLLLDAVPGPRDYQVDRKHVGEPGSGVLAPRFQP